MPDTLRRIQAAAARSHSPMTQKCAPYLTKSGKHTTQGLRTSYLLWLVGGMVGTHAGDMIGEVALAIEMGADAVEIGKTIHPYPTLGESIGMAAEVAHGSCTDMPPARK